MHNFFHNAKYFLIGGFTFSTIEYVAGYNIIDKLKDIVVGLFSHKKAA